MSNDTESSTGESKPKPQDLYDPDGWADGRFRIMKSVERDLSEKNLAILKERTRKAMQDFPELTATTVTIAKADPTDGRYFARADWWNDLIFVPTDGVVDYITLYHELGHLAINRMDRMGYDVPKTSERFCSILSIARMPADRVEECGNRNIPYLGTPPIPQREWPSKCRQALDYRKNNRDYIKKCKRLLSLIGNPRDDIVEEPADA